jgi:hypothetical protein
MSDFMLRLQQIQLASTGYRFGAPLNLQLVKDFPVVSFDSIQSQEKPLTDLMIREPLSNELQYL